MSTNFIIIWNFASHRFTHSTTHFVSSISKKFHFFQYLHVCGSILFYWSRELSIFNCNFNAKCLLKKKRLKLISNDREFFICSLVEVRTLSFARCLSHLFLCITMPAGQVSHTQDWLTHTRAAQQNIIATQLPFQYTYIYLFLIQYKYIALSSASAFFSAIQCLRTCECICVEGKWYSAHIECVPKLFDNCEFTTAYSCKNIESIMRVLICMCICHRFRLVLDHNVKAAVNFALTLFDRSLLSFRTYDRKYHNSNRCTFINELNKRQDVCLSREKDKSQKNSAVYYEAMTQYQKCDYSLRRTVS